jgi:hypothetical protein
VKRSWVISRSSCRSAPTLGGRGGRDELPLERAAHLLELGGHLLLERACLALERVHAALHPRHLLLELEHLLHAGQVHAELGGQLLDPAQPVDVLLRVKAGVLG